MLSDTKVLVSDHALNRFNERIEKADKEQIIHYIIRSKPCNKKVISEIRKRCVNHKTQIKRYLGGKGKEQTSFIYLSYKASQRKQFIFVLSVVDIGKFVLVTCWER